MGTDAGRAICGLTNALGVNNRWRQWLKRQLNTSVGFLMGVLYLVNKTLQAVRFSDMEMTGRVRKTSEWAWVTSFNSVTTCMSFT